MASQIGKQFAKLPVSNKLAIGALLLMVTAALYYTSLYSSVDEAIEAERRRQTQLQEDLAAAQALQRQFVALREELQARKALDEGNLRVLPNTSEIATVLQDLNRLAELSGLDIRSVQPQPEVSEEFYVRIPVSLQVSGRYHQLAKFFHNVSRLQRAINIENIQIQRKPTEQPSQDEEIILDVAVRATTFRRKKQEEQAGPEEDEEAPT